MIHAPSEPAGCHSPTRWSISETLSLAAEEAGIIDRPGRDALTDAMKRLHFADRRFARLAEATDDAAVRDWLTANQVRRKRLDAVAMLEAMRTFLAEIRRRFRRHSVSSGRWCGSSSLPRRTRPMTLRCRC